ncbi:MAG: DUF4845 domain-containing protein [Betaproteobacteria bacterium]|nr:DUF4845 domain-containing protein [Betaproteobacteria bacterium]
MHCKQRGVTMFGLLIVAILVVVAAVGAMKIGPAYIEYFSAKKAAVAIVASGEVRNATVADIRKAFDRRAGIDNVNVVHGSDLEITKEGGEVVISFAYPKKIPLFGNVSLLIEFAGSSSQN